MVTQDEYPNFSKMQCQICEELFELPRGWVEMPFLGKQIIVDWESAELLMKTHNDIHMNDLVSETEAFLAAQGPRSS